LVIAVPRKNGHAVLDMAISQYAVGKLKQYKANNNEPLPLPGGYDDDGKLSTDAAAILKSQRLLPVGFWKGSGLSLVLDLLATILSGGNSTAEITKSEHETGISQVFICIRPDSTQQTESLIEEIIEYTKTSFPEYEGASISYPGEGTLRTREKNLREGVPVDEGIWNEVVNM
jgi:3-dehydro-L-gulonate 2-dehydrogenase